MATTLHQLLGVLDGVKARSAATIDTSYKLVQRPGQFEGFSRTYAPTDDEGTVYPPERQVVQARAEAVLVDVQAALVRLFDTIATVDSTNATAKADVILPDGTTVRDVPAVTLLAVEKRLVDLRTLVGKLPTLDLSETWEFDPSVELHRSEPSKTTKTEKVQQARVVVPATEHHPAQVMPYTDDVVVGWWTRIRFSGAVTPARVRVLTDRVDVLIEAVRKARAAANDAPAVDLAIGEALLGYVFRT